ncbi:MAG TPA: hypothetical protein VLF39_01750 [Candidatus Saccharimonadales bacterium]|nr:hypothetical protein [Candidatus Saccharimonadales bacterium]
MANFENHPLYPGAGVPFFIAAGVLKEAAHFEPFMDIKDPLVVPALTSGGWTQPNWAGNATNKDPIDFVYYSDKKMAGNARGLPGSGLEGMRKLSEPIKRLSDRGIKTIIQVTNLPHETPTKVIPMLVEEAMAQNPTAVEVNLSCPNGLKEDGSFHPPTCNNPEVSAEVMSASRNRVGEEVCLGAKDSPHVTSLEDQVDEAGVTDLIIATSPYVDFFTGINTIGAQPFPEIKCAGGKGGMSGPVVAPIAREWLKIARAVADERIPILSCGGIDSENIATELPLRQELGAMLVGGAQEWYRSARPDLLAERWAQAC